MATVLNIRPQKLSIMLFGQRLDFEKTKSGIKCAANLRLLPAVTEDPEKWAEFVNLALKWFDARSPRAQLDFGSCFGQHIRFVDNSGQLECRVVHGDTLGAKDVSEQMESVLKIVRDWLAVTQ